MEIRHEISKALYQLGMPSSSGEYSYLYEAVLAVVKDPDVVLKPLKSGLYRLVAERCFVTESTVSKALSRLKNTYGKIAMTIRCFLISVTLQMNVMPLQQMYSFRPLRTVSRYPTVQKIIMILIKLNL